MGKYIHYFDTEADFNEVRTNNYVEPWVSYTEEGGGVAYNITEEERKRLLLSTPFTIEALGSGDIGWSLGSKTVQYSKNGGSWETMTSGTTISVASGDRVRFKGTNENYSGNTITTTGQFNVKGNIMSLTDGDDFETADTISQYCFTSLFSFCLNLVSAKDLKLPVMELASHCYQYLFNYCTRLSSAPELPATSLAQSCYNGMFKGCHNLTTAPELPATEFEGHGFAHYYEMFADCTSLVNAPELPATAVTVQSYYGMFDGCTSLTGASELPATTLSTACYQNMFRGCSKLVSAPVLPAQTLSIYCYQSMFDYCSKLNYVKALFIALTQTNATTNWLRGVASTGTFVKNASATWTTTGASGVPTGWTVQTATA